MKKYSIQALRPLWIVMPFLPLLPFLSNIWSMVWLLLLLYSYFFPVIIILYATSWVSLILPGFFDPILQICVGLLFLGYCCFFAYGFERILGKSNLLLSLRRIILIYVSFLTPIILILTFFVAISPFSILYRSPISKEQREFVEYEYAYVDYYDFFALQTFIRIDYDEGFDVLTIPKQQVNEFEVNQIPDSFFHIWLVWWWPQKTIDAKSYISEQFNFEKQRLEGYHWFIYDIPSKQVCYIGIRLNHNYHKNY